MTRIELDGTTRLSIIAGCFLSDFSRKIAAGNTNTGGYGKKYGEAVGLIISV